MKSTLLSAVLATAALAASAGAHAYGSNVPTGDGPAARAVAAVLQAQAAHRPLARGVPVHAQQVYGVSEGYGPRYAQGRHERDRCGAPRWDPSVRYLPGQVVWRHGELWVARGVSARVYNENSPPEWTPNYWAPAVCG